jgi:hypothetical protein
MLRSSLCWSVILPPDIIDIPDVNEPAPLEDDPSWEIPPDPTPDPDPEPPPLVVNPGREIAQDRLEENGVAYRNPNAGPKDKHVKAVLEEIEQQQGYIAPLVKDQDNWIGSTYDPVEGKVKIDKKIGGIFASVAETIVAVGAGEEIGAVVKNGKIYATVRGDPVTNGDPVPPSLETAATGLVAKGPATALWISSFEAKSIGRGYGSGYGFAYGETI